MTKLAIGAFCLAFHGPLLYKAKILKIHEAGSKTVIDKNGSDTEVDLDEIPEEIRKETCYYIHYNGWKASWDEWVSDQRLKELNDENLQLQKELVQSLKPPKKQNTPTQGTSSPPQTSANKASTPAKRKADSTETNTGTSSSSKKAHQESIKSATRAPELERKNEFTLQIPDDLKTILVDDWEYITKDHQLISLPANTTVQDILEAYQGSFGTNQLDITETEKLKEFCSGLRLYFNRSLGKLLLYRFERYQYLNLYESAKTPDGGSYESKDIDYSKLYGGEHLLRLLVVFPSLIATSMMDQVSVGILKNMIEKFLVFLNEKKDTYFSKSYENSPPHYEAEGRLV
ncbi:hypothetical protein WICPIJ_001673 [Wickerhamomyces pijperi]|uniref:Chromatin modification-related protein EAF3 n=1 Tax=Wickerhamomyces pijperi TaxID=599730 RepID=A0A9P8QD61_WICPI|nr:hypothetical protein WICPIJ_001673 [Wickerhamomyces pijperi]